MKKFNKNLAISSLALSFVFVLVLPAVVLATSPGIINLGSSGNFTILAKTGVSTTGPTSVVGDIGLSPAAASYVTGFALSLPAASPFATSALVTGRVYAPGYADPTPAMLTTAVLDMQNAYTDGAGRAAGTTELGAGNIGGLTLVPGVYKWSTGVTIPTDVTLSGGANDVWIFEIAQNLTTSSSTHIVLSGGAQAGNIFWVVAGQTTLGTNSVFNGNILDQTSIVLNTGAVLNGRALAQAAVTLDSNTVTIPSTTVSNTTTSNPNPNNSNQGLVSPSTSTYTYTYTPTQSAMTNVPGCTGTTGFSATTGQSCSGNTTTVTTTTPIVIPGCNNGTAGFSSVNGQSCTGNTGSVTTTTMYNFGSVTLREGSKGNAVVELQKFLNKNLKMNLKLDGKLGKATAALVKKWQKDHGLTADGLIGAKTKAQMNVEAGNNN